MGIGFGGNKIENSKDKAQILNSQAVILEKLISFDTTSNKSNLELINYICDYLSVHKIEPSKIYNDDKSKTSIYYTIGDRKLPGLVLSAHTDTVPADKDQWSYLQSRPLHIELCDWADFLIVAPLTATTLSKWVSGNAEGLIPSILIANNKPIIVAPAMNSKMWINQALSLIHI